MAKIAVLIGNGLSIALSRELSLPKITSRFLNSLNRVKPEDRALVGRLMSDKNDKTDFEKCIASIEKFYDKLHHQDLSRGDVEHGRKLGGVNGLNLVELENDEKSIRESAVSYLLRIK